MQSTLTQFLTARSNLGHTNSNNLAQRIYVWNETLSGLKNVVILANFDVTRQSITADFPYTGTWHNLMDESTLNVSSTNQAISLAPGEFKIYGNQQATLSNYNPKMLPLGLRQNPVKERIEIDLPTEDAYSYKLYNSLGQEISGTKKTTGKILTLTAPKQKGLYFVLVKNDNSPLQNLMFQSLSRSQVHLKKRLVSKKSYLLLSNPRVPQLLR